MLCSPASSIITYLENVDDDIVLCALPLSFDYGLYQLFMIFKFGGTLVLERSFTYPANVMRQVAAERSPVSRRADHVRHDVEDGPEHVRLEQLAVYHQHGRSFADRATLKKFASYFRRRRCFSMYGLTETKRTLYLPPEPLGRSAGFCGSRNTRYGSVDRR